MASVLNTSSSFLEDSHFLDIVPSTGTIISPRLLGEVLWDPKYFEAQSGVSQGNDLV